MFKNDQSPSKKADCSWLNVRKHSSPVIRGESFITSWGDGYIQGGGVGNCFGDVLGVGVENKMTYGQGGGGHVFRQVLGGQMCSTGLSFH